MFKTGLTLGKFMPPHVGHEYMIDLAASLCDNLIVLVGGQETDVIPVSLRHKWLVKHYATQPNIEFVLDKQDIPVTEVDENGTCVDPEFWKQWKRRLYWITHRRSEPNIDAIFTSDHYGKRLAEELDAVWVPVDPKREMFQISATEIRQDPMKYFSFLMDEARPYYTKKVAIVGPESCGKTVLSKELAQTLNTVYVPEYGRILSEAKNNDLTEDDFKLIADAQEALTDILIKKANRILIQDTEMLTTYLFGKVYLNMDLTYLKDRAKKQEFDLYIVLAPTVKWMDDGSRVLSDKADRNIFFVALVDLLDELNKPYVIIDEEDYPDRNVSVSKAIEKLLE